MFRDIVLQDTRPDEWPALRARIRDRVSISLGTPPDVQVEPESVRLSRLRLCEVTAGILKLGLGLLGIEVVERM